LTVKLPNGANLDVVANKVITSGRIAADLTLRDQTLVQAQTPASISSPRPSPVRFPIKPRPARP